MAEEKHQEEEFSFVKEKIKRQRFYQNQNLSQGIISACAGSRVRGSCLLCLCDIAPLYGGAVSEGGTAGDQPPP